MSLALVAVAFTTSAALVSLGGGAYEYLVVDPCWPRRVELIQPGRGGVSRRRFWMPAHGVFELCLIVSLVQTWGVPEVRPVLLIALTSHVCMCVWSFADFIPKAMVFERVEPQQFDRGAAQRWTRRSLGRLPLDLITCGAMLAALVSTARLG